MGVFDDVALQRVTTAQQVSEAISRKILGGHFAPGHRLREAAIATELGVARNTVREAVRILELGGLVQHQVNRGAVVISPTAEKVDEVYLARKRLECLGVRSEASEPLVAAVGSAFDALAAAAATHDVDRIVTADLAFHSTLAALIGSARIDGFYAALTRELHFYLTILSVHDREYEDESRIVEEHAAIFEPFRAGDRERAEIEVARHIEVNQGRVREILAEHYS